MLKENSVLYSYMYHNPGKIKNIGSPGRRGVISTVLFLASLLTLFAAIALAGFMTGDDGDLYKNMWVFFCFTPIPLSSLIYGFVLKAKGCKYKKNVIIGIIMTILLCIYGSFSFIFWSDSEIKLWNEEQLWKNIGSCIKRFYIPAALRLYIILLWRYRERYEYYVRQLFYVLFKIQSRRCGGVPL